MMHRVHAMEMHAQCVCVCESINTRSLSPLLKNESVSKERKWTDHFETPHCLGKMEDFSLSIFVYVFSNSIIHHIEPIGNDCQWNTEWCSRARGVIYRETERVWGARGHSKKKSSLNESSRDLFWKEWIEKCTHVFTMKI